MRERWFLSSTDSDTESPIRACYSHWPLGFLNRVKLLVDHPMGLWRDRGVHRSVQMWALKLDRVDWVALIAVFLVTGTLLVLSTLRYLGYNTSMLDLGNMAQAIWSGTQGSPLEFTYQYGNISRLALHVELIYWLFVPLYALLPDPRTLLVIQALLFAVGAWPVYRLAMRHLKHRNLARVLVLCYLFYPVAQTAVLFDFHGDTLAMPLLLFALEALDRQAWRSYAFWILLALCSKFYVAAAVASLGGVLWLRGQRRVGIWTFLAAVAWLTVALGVIRPLFAPPQAAQSHLTFLSYFKFYFGGAGPALLHTAVGRILTAFIVFAPGLWLARYAWQWILPAFAIAVPALASLGDVAAYHYRFHHYALTVPFFIVATLYGAVELRRRQEQLEPGQGRRQRPWHGELFLAFGIIIIFNVGFVDTPLNPLFWLDKPHWGTNHWRYGRIPRDTFKDRWLRQHVPAKAPLAASEFLAPHLRNRRILYLVRYPDELKALGQPDDQSETLYLIRHPDALQNLLLSDHVEEVQYVVADALYEFALPFGEGLQIGGVMHDVPGIMVTMQHPEFGLLAAQDGLLLFGRNPVPGEALRQEFRLSAWEGQRPAPEFRIGERIGLLKAQVEPVGDRRFRLRYEWVALQPLDEAPPLFAVTRLEGVDHSRIVHPPTLALHPTPHWQPGQIVQEEFEFELPEELSPGTYQLLTGWYDSSNPFAAATDARSRIGQEVHSGRIDLR